MKKKMIKLLVIILILICIPMFSSCIAESIDSTAETVDMTDLDTSIQGGGTEDDTSSDSGNTDKGNLGDTDIYCTFYRYNDAYHNISNTLSQLVSGGKEDIENFVNIFSDGGLSTGLFCEYYSITEEEYKAFCEKQDDYKQNISKIEAIRTQIKNNESVNEDDLFSYAYVLWELHFGDYRNNEVFYNKYFDAEKCKDLTILPDNSCNHISMYHTIDHRLLEYVGVVNAMEFKDQFGATEDFNIVKFVEYFDIDKEEFKSIIANYSKMSDPNVIYLYSPLPYPLEYLYGDESAQKLCFEVHKTAQ